MNEDLQKIFKKTFKKKQQKISIEKMKEKFPKIKKQFL